MILHVSPDGVCVFPIRSAPFDVRLASVMLLWRGGGGKTLRRASLASCAGFMFKKDTFQSQSRCGVEKIQMKTLSRSFHRNHKFCESFKKNAAKEKKKKENSNVGMPKIKRIIYHRIKIVLGLRGPDERDSQEASAPS